MFSISASLHKSVIVAVYLFGIVCITTSLASTTWLQTQVAGVESVTTIWGTKVGNGKMAHVRSLCEGVTSDTCDNTRQARDAMVSCTVFGVIATLNALFFPLQAVRQGKNGKLWNMIIVTIPSLITSITALIAFAAFASELNNSSDKLNGDHSYGTGFTFGVLTFVVYGFGTVWSAIPPVEGGKVSSS